MLGWYVQIKMGWAKGHHHHSSPKHVNHTSKYLKQHHTWAWTPTASFEGVREVVQQQFESFIYSKHSIDMISPSFESCRHRYQNTINIIAKLQNDISKASYLNLRNTCELNDFTVISNETTQNLLLPGLPKDAWRALASHLSWRWPAPASKIELGYHLRKGFPNGLNGIPIWFCGY